MAVAVAVAVAALLFEEQLNKEVVLLHLKTYIYFNFYV
jgi:hypothetical protein